MKIYRNIFLIIICIFLVGCKNEYYDNEYKSYAIDDTISLHTNVDVIYTNKDYSDTLINAFNSGILSLDDFINSLKLITSYKDGGSSLYLYKSSLFGSNDYGNKNFYVMKCSSIDNNNDIYISYDKNYLKNICNK